MKVRIKRWHGVAIWKWEIDEDVSCNTANYGMPFLNNSNFHRFVVSAGCHMKLAVQTLSFRETIALRSGESVATRFICSAL